ncbi:hypothetical protein CK489_28795 [Bradyrhizobium sp. UFLA03-84]|uniref:hypothetical protein n=1 Tax=Bradyrhizobium sp. UFLA03-84 TaxID=418599 RepID=UPI000BADF701|nr:hypothetical protein [Bradyrhizobium sp. UFLA03-84]PAY05391.1 hypothetical protein CK489_28795 [Bradyrhizobium sp. UFLA03-84]
MADQRKFGAACDAEAARVRAEEGLSEDEFLELELTPELLALLEESGGSLIEIVEEIDLKNG